MLKSILAVFALSLFSVSALCDDTPSSYVHQAGAQAKSDPDLDAPTDPLLRQAASELRTALQPYSMSLPDETIVFHWTNSVSKPEQLPKYLDAVPTNFGSGLKGDDWVGPGLYAAQDPQSSWGSYGHQLVVLQLRKGTLTVYASLPGAFPLKLDANSKIRAWLLKTAESGGRKDNHGYAPDLYNPRPKKPDLSKVTPSQLSDLAGGGDLLRAAGVGAMLYDWNSHNNSEGCDSNDNTAVSVIDPRAITQAKVIVDDALSGNPFSKFKSSGDLDFGYIHLLSLDADKNRPDNWHDGFPADDFQAYQAWKKRFLLNCRKPYIEDRFLPFLAKRPSDSEKALCALESQAASLKVADSSVLTTLQITLGALETSVAKELKEADSDQVKSQLRAQLARIEALRKQLAH